MVILPALLFPINFTSSPAKSSRCNSRRSNCICPAFFTGVSRRRKMKMSRARRRRREAITRPSVYSSSPFARFGAFSGDERRQGRRLGILFRRPLPPCFIHTSTTTSQSQVGTATSAASILAEHLPVRPSNQFLTRLVSPPPPPPITSSGLLLRKMISIPRSAMSIATFNSLLGQISAPVCD